MFWIVHANSWNKSTELTLGSESVKSSASCRRQQAGSLCPRKIRAREALTTDNAPFYARCVEVFASTGKIATALSASPLVRVAQLVRPHLDVVEARIAEQAAAFDPAIEGYVVYAVGSRGKRLRPLLALLAAGATGKINSDHVDLAVIVELIHIATLVHDDVMDEAEVRRPSIHRMVECRLRRSERGVGSRLRNGCPIACEE